MFCPLVYCLFEGNSESVRENERIDLLLSEDHKKVGGEEGGPELES